MNRSGLASQADIIVGIPMLTSVNNLCFWLRLCNVLETPEAAVLIEAFRRQELCGPTQFAHFAADWNERLIQQVRRIVSRSADYACYQQSIKSP